MALSVPRFKAGVGRQKLELQLHWGCKGAIKRRSKLEKKSLVRTSCGTSCEFYQSTSRVPFQPILFYDYVLTLGNNVN